MPESNARFEELEEGILFGSGEARPGEGRIFVELPGELAVPGPNQDLAIAVLALSFRATFEYSMDADNPQVKKGDEPVDVLRAQFSKKLEIVNGRLCLRTALTTPSNLSIALNRKDKLEKALRFAREKDLDLAAVARMADNGEGSAASS